ncbi:MAG: UbiX family flavin prenyltransferase [Anaerolineales bacterium]
MAENSLGQRARDIVVGISGASGAIYGRRLLEALAEMEVTTHLVVTHPAAVTIRQELEVEPDAIRALATHAYDPANLAAPIASGSFITSTAGMIVAPCSIKTLSAIAHSYTANLLTRAADVTLKEGRPLILVVRETPLHLGHLRLMAQAAENGAVIFPPVPAFYHRPATIEAMVDHTVGRILARMGVSNRLYRPWQGGDVA